MSTFLAIQQAVADHLRSHSGFPAKIQIIARREKTLENDIAAALGKIGICLFVMPPMPKHAERTLSEIVFFGKVEQRIRIIEQPKVNTTKFDAWDAAEQVIFALQAVSPSELFTTPLFLDEHPITAVEDKDTRVFDVIFTTAFELNP